MHKEPFDTDTLARELFEFIGPRYEAACSYFDLEDGRRCVVIEERSGAEVVITIERRPRAIHVSPCSHTAES